jgi:hypothetical protein
MYVFYPNNIAAQDLTRLICADVLDRAARQLICLFRSFVLLTIHLVSASWLNWPLTGVYQQSAADGYHTSARCSVSNEFAAR